MPHRRALRGHSMLLALLAASSAAIGNAHANDMRVRVGVDVGYAENDSRARPGFELGLVSARGWGLALASRTLDEAQLESILVDFEGGGIQRLVRRGKLESRSLMLTYVHALPDDRFDVEARLGVHDWEHSFFDANNEGVEGVAGFGFGWKVDPRWRLALGVEWFGVNSHRVHRLSSRLEYTFP